MKNLKKFISLGLTALMLISVFTVAPLTVSANAGDNQHKQLIKDSKDACSARVSTGAGNTIYFNSSGWENVTTVYCHIWKRGGDAFYTWQAKQEKCKSEGNDKWSYESPALKSGEDYCIIISCNTGKQTYECTLGTPCFGDTLKLTGSQIENPVDSEKKSDEAVWEKNSSSYGPHLAFTSIGNIVGSKLCPNEKGTEVIGDWLPTYYKSWYVKPVDALVNAFPIFGIKSADDITTIYNYIVSKNTFEDEDAMKKILDEAFEKAYPASPTHSSSIFKVFSYVPSPEQALKGYNYKLSVQDKKGNVTIFDFITSNEFINGARVYKAEVPDDLEISMLYYQVFDGDNWLSQISVNPAEAENKIINSEGKAVTESDYTTPAVTTPNVTNPNDKPANNNNSQVNSKKDNPIKVTVKTKTVKAKKLKKKAQKVKAITVKNNKGKVTYKLVKKGITKKIRKLVKINSKGVITIKKWKKAKKGTYKIKVTVKAAGNSFYNAKTITNTVKVKVK